MASGYAGQMHTMTFFRTLISLLVPVNLSFEPFIQPRRNLLSEIKDQFADCALVPRVPCRCRTPRTRRPTERPRYEDQRAGIFFLNLTQLGTSQSNFKKPLKLKFIKKDQNLFRYFWYESYRMISLLYPVHLFQSLYWTVSCPFQKQHRPIDCIQDQRSTLPIFSPPHLSAKWASVVPSRKTPTTLLCLLEERTTE